MVPRQVRLDRIRRIRLRRIPRRSCRPADRRTHRRADVLVDLRGRYGHRPRPLGYPVPRPSRRSRGRRAAVQAPRHCREEQERLGHLAVRVRLLGLHPACHDVHDRRPSGRQRRRPCHGSQPFHDQHGFGLRFLPRLAERHRALQAPARHHVGPAARHGHLLFGGLPRRHR